METDKQGTAAKRLKAQLCQHFTKHLACNENVYLFFIISLAAGIFAGAFTAGCLDSSLREEIAVIFENYALSVRTGNVPAFSGVLIDNLAAVLRPLFLLMLCGFSVFAIAAGIFFLSVKGFAAGFFTAAAVTCLGVRDCLLLLLPSVPYQILSAFCLLAAAGVGAAHRKMEEHTAVYLAQMAIIWGISAGSVFLDLVLKRVLWGIV